MVAKCFGFPKIQNDQWTAENQAAKDSSMLCRAHLGQAPHIAQLDRGVDWVTRLSVAATCSKIRRVLQQWNYNDFFPNGIQKCKKRFHSEWKKKYTKSLFQNHLNVVSRYGYCQISKRMDMEYIRKTKIRLTSFLETLEMFIEFCGGEFPNSGFIIRILAPLLMFLCTFTTCWPRWGLL